MGVIFWLYRKSHPNRLELLPVTASSAIFGGDISYANQCAQEAYQFWCQSDDKLMLVQTLSSLGFLKWLNGEIDAAETIFLEGLQLTQLIEEKFLESGFYFFLATFYLSTPGKYHSEKIKMYAEHGLQVARQINNHYYLIINLSVLANFHLQQKELNLAKAYFEEC